jgi:hypothetical protein
MLELALKHPWIFVACFFGYPVPFVVGLYRVIWGHYTRVVKEKDDEIKRLNEERIKEAKQTSDLINVLTGDTMRTLGALRKKLKP